MKKLIKLFSLAVVTISLVVSSSVAKVDGDTIVLGAAISLTGKYSTNGKHTKNGYDLAVREINKKGGVTVNGKKYKIEVKYYDDESTPARAAQLAERLIKQDGIQFLLGPYSSGLTKAMAPVSEKYKVPMIEANGASRSLFTKGYKYLFAILTSADQYLSVAIDVLAEKAEEAGKRPRDMKIAIAMENDPFSQDVRLGILEAAKKYKMKVVIDDKLPKTLDDMAATLAKVKAVKPDILAVSGHAKGAATAARQIEQFKVNVDMIALTHCDSAAIESKFPKGSSHILCALQWQKELTYKDDDGVFGTGLDFVKLFRETYNYEPPYQSAESAAAVQVYADAFARANSFNTLKVRNAIAKTKMQTFYGNVRFNKAGQNIAKPMVLSQIIDGSYKVVAPTKWATTPIVYPKPNL
ncbi:branched-chain amino acid transport system substrate-binding protein [Spirochaetota bacterium]|nr:branched-chain amino acid transport system substrate-binding protein [Spirochaetota bacterium]